MSRFDYLLPERFPEVPGKATDYPALLDRALREWYRVFRRAVSELNAGPVLLVGMAASQALTVGVLTPVQFGVAAVDTGLWLDAFAGVYTPQEPGFYRCTWNINFHDSVAFATSTYGYAQLVVSSTAPGAPVRPPHLAIGYGNGSGLDITAGGTAIVECDGRSDGISVQAFVNTGSSPVVFHDGAVARSWLHIDYVGRRLVQT